MNQTTVTKNYLKDLKLQTKALHDATEAVAFSKEMQGNTFTLAMYKKLVQSNSYIHKNLERSFEETFKNVNNPALKAFVDKKSNWLEKDSFWSKDLAQIATLSTTVVPSFTTVAELIGGLYVVEGSMLGGRFIVRLLKQNPALQEIPVFHFYSGYGEHTGKRWKKFQQLAIATLQNDTDFETALTKAKATFSFFYGIYANNNNTQ